MKRRAAGTTSVRSEYLIPIVDQAVREVLAAVLIALAGLILSGAAAQAAPSLKYIRAHAIRIRSGSDLPENLYAQLQDYKIIAVGELHGTNETPRFIRGLIRLMVGHHRSVMLALELPKSSQAAIDSFLKDGDRGSLHKDSFFAHDRDGRASQAMVNLLNELRALTRVDVVCVDPGVADGAQDRDTKMAKLFYAAYSRSHADVTILLAGNVHVSSSRGFDFAPGYEPMMYQLRTRGPLAAARSGVLTILESYGGGATWCCGGNPMICAETKNATDASVYATATDWNGYFLKAAGLSHGYDALAFVRKSTASPPINARDQNSRGEIIHVP